ncbi:hypothetical protein AYK25_04295 [Thermoplasmatales archaeon SM1-50]|nr:MAG: hypothetical protein AYK25_04295 [Thermoplasmatales archaeon SM1-50]
MQQLYLVTIILLGFCVLSSAATALFTSPYDFTGTLSSNTVTFIIGKTTVRGACTGYPMESLIESSLVQEMEGFPLIGKNNIAYVASVIVAENIDITTATSLEVLVIQYYNHLTQYRDVEIITEDGFVLFGVQKANTTISADFPYAVTTFIPLGILPEKPTRFFFTGADSPLLMHSSGDFAVLTTLSETSTIKVKDRAGRIRWSGGSQRDYLLIQDTTFSITQQPPLSLVPLGNSSEKTPLTLSISPIDSSDITATQLLENISTSVKTNLKDEAASGFLNNINQLNLLIQTASFITNGALVFLQINDTMTVDQSTQQFSSVGLVRFNTIDITDSGMSEGPLLQGDCILVFQGDHFYTPQAKQSLDGTRFPYELLIIWTFAISVFIYVSFIMRPSINIEKGERIKRYALFIHLIVLIIVFLLLEREVYVLFGASGLMLLFSQGLTMVTRVFLIIEILIWTLGFFSLALPIQLLSYSVLRVRGIEKGGNGIWKAVGDLFIWVFCGLYLLLFLNIISALISFPLIYPMG